MKKLLIEFKYFDKQTCSRCRATDENVEKTVKKLREALEETDTNIDFKTTKLSASRLSESNSLLINGKDVEEIVNGKKKQRETACYGCGTLINGSCDCRAYTYRGKSYRYIPKTMIKEAIKKSLP